MEIFPSDVQKILRKAQDSAISSRAHPSVHTDPFYTGPSGLDYAPPGTILKLEDPTDTTPYALPPNTSLTRFIYQSETLHGRRVPVSAYILWPYTARPHASGHPIVAWAHGTSGVLAEAAPSNCKDLFHNFQAPFQFALNGYVVVATDYAGLGVGRTADGRDIVHEYLHPAAQANDVLYSVLAAKAAFPNLGGGAAWGVAEKLAAMRRKREAVEGYLGAVVMSPVVSVTELPQGMATVCIVLMLCPNLHESYPDFEPEQVLTDEGLKALEVYLEMGGGNSVLFNMPLRPHVLKEDWRGNPAMVKYQQAARLGRRPIAGPLMVVTGEADDVSADEPVFVALQSLVKSYPDTSVDYCTLPGLSHAPALYPGWLVYSRWIEDRFQNAAAGPGLRGNSVQPCRLRETQVKIADWILQKECAK